MVPVGIFSTIIFCVTVQLWLVLVKLISYIPLGNILSNVVLPEGQFQIRPERDAFLFHLFVGMVLLAQAIGIWCARKKLEDPLFARNISPFLIVELIWTALLLNAYFKGVTNSHLLIFSPTSAKNPMLCHNPTVHKILPTY